MEVKRIPRCSNNYWNTGGGADISRRLPRPPPPMFEKKAATKAAVRGVKGDKGGSGRAFTRVGGPRVPRGREPRRRGSGQIIVQLIFENSTFVR